MKTIIRYLLLLGVAPLLIGHGASQCGLDFDCPTDNGFALAATHSATTPLSYEGTMRLVVNGVDKPTVVMPDGGLQFRVFDDEVHDVRVAIDSAMQVGSLGEFWLRNFARNTAVKLSSRSHNERSGVFFDVTFLIAPSDYALPQQSMIASGSQYTLSGGSTGGDFLQIGQTADVYLNGVLLFTTRATGSATRAPYVFNANVGDIVRFNVVADAGGTTDTGELWLHKPSGQGVKLLHRARVSASVPLDVSYRIE